MRLSEGFSLIEVLVSLLLISLILFGLDTMQIFSMKEAKIAYFYNTAVNQLNNMLARLSALQGYEGLNQQVIDWNRENQTVLPMGFGEVSGVFPNYIATIYWGSSPHYCIKQQIGLSGCIKKIIQLG